MEQAILESLYDELVETLVAKVPSMERSTIQENYRKYLEENILPLIDDLKSLGHEEQRILTVMIDTEKIRWKGKPGSYVLSVLLPDPAFENFQELSSMAFGMAIQKKKTGTIDETDYTDESFEAAVIKCFDELQDFNKEASRLLLSETLLDIRFAYGNSELMSFRLSHRV